MIYFFYFSSFPKQSHKYGYCPLPKYIAKSAFEDRLSLLDADTQKLALVS